MVGGRQNIVSKGRLNIIIALSSPSLSSRRTETMGGMSSLHVICAVKATMSDHRGEMKGTDPLSVPYSTNCIVSACVSCYGNVGIRAKG